MSTDRQSGLLFTRSKKFRILTWKIDFGVLGLFRIRKKKINEKSEDFDEFPCFFRI